MRILVILVMILISGCDSFRLPRFEVDQELRREIFFECLKALPAGPVETKYNDWSEVVVECDNVAMYQSRNCVKYCE